jgi:catechol 2,3-dioxygenase-like lactoylglutathione lyase family enzyme
MVAIRAVIHFSVPVSDVAKSTQFYTDVVGCRLLSTTPNGQMVFLDAAVTCLMLVKRDAPINPVLDDHGAFIMPSRLRTTSTKQRSTRRTRGSGKNNGAMLPISLKVRSGGHWNSNLAPIITQQRHEPEGSRRKPRPPG